MNEEHLRNIAAECSATSLVVEMLLASVFGLLPDEKKSLATKILTHIEHINPTWTAGGTLEEQELFIDVHHRMGVAARRIVQNALDMSEVRQS